MIDLTVKADHYQGDIIIAVCEMFGFGFSLGNAIKYICRAGLKDGNPFDQDIRKSIVYLRKAINYKAVTITDKAQDVGMLVKLCRKYELDPDRTGAVFLIHSAFFSPQPELLLEEAISILVEMLDES